MRRLDLTKGSILKQLIKLSIPIVFSMFMLTLYFVADLWFVGRLGPSAVAAVSISINAFFVILALAMTIGIGGMALIAQAYGRKDYQYGGRVFQQSLMLCVLTGITATAVGLSIARSYVEFFGAEGDSLVWGVEYFRYYSVLFPIMLTISVTGHCYRGMGNSKTPMIIILQSNLLNIILDPVLIYGWAGIPGFGVKGAAIASIISQGYGLSIYFYLIFLKGDHPAVKSAWKIDTSIIKKSLKIGAPTGFTHLVMAANMVISYRVIGSFGIDALASLGIGFRILQAIYLPALAINFAMAAMVGQNFGAREYGRIVRIFWTGWALSSCIMLAGTVVCWLVPGQLIGIFSNKEGVIHYGIIYLTIVSLGNILIGIIQSASSTFQGLGKTNPALIGAILGTLVYTLAVFNLPEMFGWGINAIWWCRIAALALEAAILTVCLRSYFFHVRKMLI